MQPVLQSNDAGYALLATAAPVLHQEGDVLHHLAENLPEDAGDH